jgi:hypothetical protein
MKRKLLSLLLVLIIVLGVLPQAALAAGESLSIEETQYYEVTIITTPTGADVSVSAPGGEIKAESSGVYHLEAGSYTAQAHMMGYEDTTITFSVSEAVQSHTVHIELTALLTDQDEPAAQVATLSAAEPLLTGLTIRTSTSTTDWSNALLAGEVNSSGVVVFDPETYTYTLSSVTDSTTQLRFWFNKDADVSSVVLYWGEESKAFTSTTNQWANCLSAGRNIIRLTVTPTIGDAVEYSFVIDVLPSLTALSFHYNDSPIYLDKTFAATTTAYTAKVPNTADEIAITATPKSDKYNVTYNGATSNLVDISALPAVNVTVTAGDVSRTYTVTLEKVPAYTASVSATPSDAAVIIYDAQGAVLARGLGSASTNGVTAASYVVTKNGYIAQAGAIPDGTPVSVSLAEAPVVDLPAYTGVWTSFRGNPENMGITSAKTPDSPETAILKWAEKYGSGWSAAPTPPLIINDALYIAVSNKVFKIDKATGKTLQESDTLVANVGFAMNPIAYGNGMFFVPVGQGRVQALRADTLESLWISENLGSLAQTVSPLVYHDGYLYTGVWNKENEPGTYFCLSVTDEDPSQKTETKLCSWKLKHAAGFYWAGAYVTDNYLIVGSDDGLPEGTYTEAAVLFSLDPKTGAVLDTVSGIKGDIRSSVSFDKSTGKAFFATKGGWFCTIKVNTDGTFDKDTFKYVDLGGMCTGTPLVYNNRAYIGSSGDNGQFGPGKLNVIDLSGDAPQLAYTADLPGYPQASALLSSAYGETAYVYITYNMSPGGIYVIEDSSRQTTAKGYNLFIPSSSMQQYAIASLVADTDGTIYYKNDSCYLMAVVNNTAYLSSLTANTGKLNKTFAAETMDYELVVPVGTNSVTLTATPCESGAVTINGEAPVAVTLTGGKATATIVVTKGSDTRTYTVTIREVSTNVTLSNASANMSNTLGGGQEFTLQDNQSSFSWANNDTSTFRRIWVKPADGKATVTASVVSGAASSLNGTAYPAGTALTGNAGTGTGAGYTRYNIYFAASCAAATIKVTVTAEDGVTTKDYLFTVTRPDTYTPVLSAGSGTRTAVDKGSVSFTSSKIGSYYYRVVESGAAEPSIDTNGAGTTIEAPGSVTISLNSLTAGAKDVYIKVKDASGNVSSALKIALPIESSGGGSTPSETISVSFRLIGSTLSKDDVDLGTGNYQDAKYQTWVTTTYYTLDKNGTVYDLFTRVLDEAGIRYTGAERNYVDTIYAPGVLGSYALSEFTNGQRSGWMYTVNGSHPAFGLKEWTLQDGDVVIWHYVNDYSYEVADWFDDDPKYPALGDGTYFNKWLSAPDVEPSASENGGGSGGGGTDAPDTKLNLNVQADKNGEARVSISEASIQEALEQAVKDASASIIIAPEINGTATKVLVEMPAASLSSISTGTTASLKIETPIGSVTIPNNALSAIALQTSGSTVTVSLEVVKTTALTTEQQAAAGTSTVYDISVSSGNKHISGFGGSSVTISLPYTLKPGETAENVTVWYLDTEGKLQRMSCTYDKTSGLATFTTTHLSYYIVSYNQWTNPFVDVKESDWYYNAVKYAVQSGLFNGTSATAFSPSNDMTRAMLVTVLYRLEGSPAATGGRSFMDVIEGQWYTSAVKWASENKLVEGYDTGLFGTDDKVTREQMATILYRYSQFKGLNVTNSVALDTFVDASDISDWSITAMKWTNAEGLITGRTASILAPQGTATRAEVATILMRFIENIKK